MRSTRITAILWKTTDGPTTEPNGMKISLSFGYVPTITFPSVPSEKVDAKINLISMRPEIC
uniref:Uncharacterized protein n=1 Tax=Romanomermis culicivorax TaxID=13658 RepID=A0A915JMJ1_ROMCU